MCHFARTCGRNLKNVGHFANVSSFCLQFDQKVERMVSHGELCVEMVVKYDTWAESYDVPKIYTSRQKY